MSSQADTGILKEGQLASDLPAADQLIDNFIQPLGGAAAFEKSSTRVESGSSQVGGKSIRVELFDKGQTRDCLSSTRPPTTALPRWMELLDGRGFRAVPRTISAVPILTQPAWMLICNSLCTSNNFFPTCGCNIRK